MSADLTTEARITVNGEPRPLRAVMTVAAFLEELGIDPRTVAVERNGRLLRRPAFDTTELVGGDRLEVVRFVQGG